MKRQLQHNQSGIVSFMVVLVIMIVLTLIVLAFAQLVRREQQQTLDRQLNTQAFYAAESGVNDARERLRTTPSLSNTDYTNCNDFISAAGLTGQSRLDGPTGVVSYSCLLVDPTPLQLTATPVPTNESVVWPLQPSPAATITRIDLSWNDGNDGTNLTNCPALGDFPGQWPTTCQIGMLRIELVPFAGNRTRNQLIDDRGVAFIQPNASGSPGTVAWPNIRADQQGQRLHADCDGNPGPERCRLSITGLNLPAGYIRVRSIYRSTDLVLRAYAGSTPVQFAGVQAEIDATGKSSDILKRIKTSVSLLSGDDPYPEFALQSLRTQCKRMEVIPPSTINISALFDGPNSACNPQQVGNN